MSLPAMRIEGLFRNRIEQVAAFLELRHPDQYMVYNLCSERSYPTHFFKDRVERYPIDDHNGERLLCLHPRPPTTAHRSARRHPLRTPVPTISQMFEFVDSARRWTQGMPERVVAVHCKGGKGRTGTMICAWLVASKTFDTAADALDW